MGIENLLKSMAGTHSQTGAGAGARAPKMPAMDAKTVKSYKELKNTLESIQSQMKGIATSKGATSELGNLAKKARKLQPLFKAIENVKKAEKDYVKLMKSSTATIHEQVKAYNKLAAAKKKQVQVGNEMQGAFGRLKNVMGSFTATNVLLGAFALVARDAVLVARQANEGFDVMARSGQALGKSFGELTSATASYSVGLNKAAISGALMGHSGDESKKAFQLLTQTFGGTGDAVENVSRNFGDLATIAKFSGMSIGDAALYADKNWKRLGKTMEDSAGDIAQMGMNTSHLNSLFGAGKVDTREYAQTVSDLSFQSGNYNQNTKFLIESLNRELAVQLSLGKSRDAAMDAARKNLEKAGKANLVGAQILGKKIQAEFDSSGMTHKEAVDWAMERFGSQGEVVLSLLEDGIEQGNNLFALAEVMKGSSEMQGELQKELRRDAAKGGSMGLAAGITNIGEQLVIQEEEEVRAKKFAAVRAAPKGDMKGIRETLATLFPGIEDIEDEGRKSEAKELIAQFGRTLREDPKVDAREEFAKVIEAIMPAEDPEKAKDPVDKFLEKIGGASLFMNAIGTITRLPEVIMGLPVSIATAIAIEEAKKAGVLGWAASLLGLDEEDDGTKQEMIRGARGRIRKKYTEEQLSENRAKKKKEELGQQYDFSKKAGRAEVKGLSREEFVETKMKEEAFAGAGRMLAQNRAFDTTFGDLSGTGDIAATAGDIAATAMVKTSGEAVAPAAKLAPVKIGDETVAPVPAGESVGARATASTSGGKLILEVDNFDSVMAQVQNDQTAIQG